MRCSRIDANGVAGLYIELGFSQMYHASAGCDVIKLLGDGVSVPLRAHSGMDGCLGQTLVCVAMKGGMQQLTNFGAVLGDVGGNRSVGRPHAVRQRLPCLLHLSWR